jgi:hypothetical protein
MEIAKEKIIVYNVALEIRIRKRRRIRRKWLYKV